jgi:SSS family solute:Na+ symporter
MMGILIAAMLAAAMGALSADYNALSSVITNDIYRRMFKPNASPGQLRTVGMLCTLLAGGLAIVVSLIILASGQTGLFNKMMVLFGLALGPTVLPMLAGLFVRRLSARGALAGFFAGFVSGISLYLYRTLFLEKQAGLTSQWVTYTFTAYSTFINVTVTIAAMTLVSFLEKRSAQVEKQIQAFFARLDTPIQPEVEAHAEVPSPFFIIGLILSGLGVILFLAGWFSPSGWARNLDWTISILLMVIGTLLFRFHRRSFVVASSRAKGHSAGKE